MAKYLFHVLNGKLFTLLGLVFFQFSMSHFFQNQLQEELRSSEGMTHFVWLLALGQIVLVVAGEALVVLTSFSLVAISDFTSLKAKAPLSSVLNQLLIEILRSWGSILRGLLLFIVPGIVRMFRYFFVIYVVLLHPEYWLGKIDALKESARVTRLLTAKEWSFLIALKLGAPLMLSFFSEGAGQVGVTPLATMGAVVLECVLILITVNWMILTLKKRI